MQFKRLASVPELQDVVDKALLGTLTEEEKAWFAVATGIFLDDCTNLRLAYETNVTKTRLEQAEAKRNRKNRKRIEDNSVRRMA